MNELSTIHFGDLATKLLDMAVNGSITDNTAIAVDPIDQLLPGKDPSGMGRKELEQMKLNHCQREENALN